MKISSIIITAVVALLLGFSAAMATTFTVDIQNFAFVPHGRHIVVGDMITWTNQDGVTHTSTSDNGVWNSGNLAHGQSYSYTFSNTGNFPYHCAIHTSMHDTIFVSPQTGIDDQPTPSKFELSQNYPNPFNAATTIKYNLPQAFDVTVTIFDITGRKVETLVSGFQDAGEHEVIWNASNASSGVYFYNVTAGQFSEMKRCVLLK
jgi:plastocyanin